MAEVGCLDLLVAELLGVDSLGGVGGAGGRQSAVVVHVAGHRCVADGEDEPAIGQVGGELSDHAEQLKVSLTIEPASGAFEGDEFAVFSLLVNLVEYALYGCSLSKSVEAGSVTVKAAVTDKDAVFEVVADGFSMEDEVRTIAFGPYYVPRGVDRSHLGLFIAHKLALNHGGTLAASVSPSPATHFSVRLPLARVADQNGDPADSAEKKLAEAWESGE